MKLKKLVRTGLVTLLLAAGIFAGSANPAAALTGQQGSGWPFGCRSQYVCLYTGTAGSVPSGAHTDYKWYGYDNFSNVLGNHYLLNNQTGGAKVYPCLGYGGTNCGQYTFYYSDGTSSHYLKAGYYVLMNFTPINSIWLTA